MPLTQQRKATQTQFVMILILATKDSSFLPRSNILLIISSEIYNTTDEESFGSSSRSFQKLPLFPLSLAWPVIPLLLIDKAKWLESTEKNQRSRWPGLESLSVPVS